MNVQNDCSKQEPSIPGKETLDMQLMILPQEKLQEPVGGAHGSQIPCWSFSPPAWFYFNENILSIYS
jgi:hypothetical protein